MTEHRYMTNDERIEKLKGQGLIFNNEGFAKSIFDSCGYYNVINGYREPFLRHDQKKKSYIEGVTFEQIFSLYQFDMQLRNVVMFSMTSFEDHFKAVLSNLIAENYGINQSSYLNKKNYKYRNVRNERYGFLTTLNTLQDLCNSKRNPVSYYMNKYGVVPPWILFKIATFGNVVVLSKYLKAPLKSELCRRLFKSGVYSDFKEDEIKRLLSDALSLFLEYRNLAAHGGRVYNHLPVALIREKKFTAKKIKIIIICIIMLSIYPSISNS